MPSPNKTNNTGSWKLWLLFLLATVTVAGLYFTNQRSKGAGGVPSSEKRMIVKRIIKDSQGEPFSVKLQREGEPESAIDGYKELFLQENAALVEASELEYLIVEGGQPQDTYKKRILYFQGAVVIRDEPKPTPNPGR